MGKHKIKLCDNCNRHFRSGLRFNTHKCPKPISKHAKKNYVKCMNCKKILRTDQRTKHKKICGNLQ